MEALRPLITPWLGRLARTARGHAAALEEPSGESFGGVRVAVGTRQDTFVGAQQEGEVIDVEVGAQDAGVVGAVNQVGEAGDRALAFLLDAPGVGEGLQQDAAERAVLPLQREQGAQVPFERRPRVFASLGEERLDGGSALFDPVFEDEFQ